MKALISVFAAFLIFSGFAIGDTYTGTVSEIKQFSKGGVAIDMDGMYPNQKMVLYIPKKNQADITLPAIGSKVTATGPVTQYYGHPEIKLASADQWKW